MAVVIVISVILIAFSIYIGVLIGTKLEKSRYSKILNEGTGKYGIIEYTYMNYNFVAEVEELEKAGDRTKIRIVEVTGNSTYIKSATGRLSKWVDSSNIKYFDNNSQKIRDKKLEEILK